MQERGNSATNATVNFNTAPLVKASVAVPESGTSTTNKTKERSEESHFNVQTEPASRNVSSNFMTPTYNVQSQVIDYTIFTARVA